MDDESAASGDNGLVSAPVETLKPEVDESVDVPWVTLVWNDPVNLMSYVTYVFMTYFHYSRERADQLMRQVHEEGRAAVAAGTREEMERHVEAMHSFGLWATLSKEG